MVTTSQQNLRSLIELLLLFVKLVDWVTILLGAKFIEATNFDVLDAL